MPQLDGDEISHAFCLPRRIGLEFQLNDSGAQTLVTFDDRPRKGGQFDTVAAIRSKTKLKNVILTALRDFLLVQIIIMAISHGIVIMFMLEIH
jgi:hypothetical protein